MTTPPCNRCGAKDHLSHSRECLRRQRLENMIVDLAVVPVIVIFGPVGIAFDLWDRLRRRRKTFNVSKKRH